MSRRRNFVTTVPTKTPETYMPRPHTTHLDRLEDVKALLTDFGGKARRA